LIETSKSIFPVIFAVLFLRSFVYEPFRIPSESMLPTLENGDFILVNKFAYGLRLPVLHTHFLGSGKPERGDIVVFRYPLDPNIDYIKRVIGLPGVEIRYTSDKTFFINGEPLEQTDLGPLAQAWYKRELIELLDEKQYRIHLDDRIPQTEGFWRVPENSYLMIGDNRDGSSDGRRWGFVPEENLVGRADLIWMNLDMAGFSVNWSRIGKKL
jgi:signal peptidase I